MSLPQDLYIVQVQERDALQSQKTAVSVKFPSVFIFLLESCSLTQTEDNPWWRVDLGYSTAIRELFIAGPLNGTELKDFEIRIGDSLENEGNDNKKCGDKHSVRPGEIKTVSCNETGRYINIRVPESGKALSLCEVVPYGMGKLNRTRQKQTTNNIFQYLQCNTLSRVVRTLR